MNYPAHTFAHNRSFRKNERLCSKKEIEELFSNGSSFYLHPFRVKYCVKQSSDLHSKVLFSVPKKRFKHSVDRNLIKRRLREAYRMNKSTLYPLLLEKKISLNIAFIYSDKEKLSFEILQNKLILTLARLVQSV